MVKQLRRWLAAAIVLAGVYGGSARDASAAQIWITNIHWDWSSSTAIDVSGGYSLVGEENTARVEVYAYSSNGDYWPAATASYGAGWFGAMVGSTYGTPYTTVYCILHYWWRGGQYWTGTSYQLHH